MYRDSRFPAIDNSAPLNVLIVKTSSLGDIIQSFPVLNYLHRRFPRIAIDWAVEESHASIAASHPLIRRAVALDIKGLKQRWHRPFAWKTLLQNLRREKYDLVFDLQGNCKSGAITLLSRGKAKVGFGPKSVREWPNLLATNIRFEIPKQINIRLQHLRLLQQYFKDSSPAEIEGVRFKIGVDEETKLARLLQSPVLQHRCKVMVCPGSKWATKQIPLETLSQLLHRIAETLDAAFLLVWGAEEEKAVCEAIQLRFADRSLLVDRMPVPTWQNLMNEADLVIAVDSSALHLCGTTSTPSFSVFGPTSSDIFKPIGQNHFAFQGKCPYGRTFPKTCSILRTCPTGACIREITAEELFSSFSKWWSERVREKGR
jgi:heptosyltransferase-1